MVGGLWLVVGGRYSDSRLSALLLLHEELCEVQQRDGVGARHAGGGRTKGMMVMMMMMRMVMMVMVMVMMMVMMMRMVRLMMVGR